MYKVKISEHSEQCLVIEWWRLESRYYGLPEEILFAIPNGGARTKKTGHFLKMEGVRPGVPDLFLAVSKMGYNGLFIEMKREDGRMSESQKIMADLLRKQGYLCVCCYGFEEAKGIIEMYLKSQ